MMRLSRHRLFGTAAVTASWGALCHALVPNRRGVITANASAPLPPVARVHFGFKLKAFYATAGAANASEKTNRSISITDS